MAIKKQEEGEGGGGCSGDGSFGRDINHLKAAGKALNDAKKEVNEWRDMEKTFGLGGGGAIASKMPKGVIQDWFKKVRDSDRLKRIIESSGRYRRLAQAKQRQKVIHGLDEVTGIEHGNHIPLMLDQEKAMLADSDFEWLILAKIADSEALCKMKRSIEDEARGPIVCIVDESGSMNGQSIAQAKGMALALYWVAQHQKRWCTLVGFSGATEGNFLTIGPDEEKVDELMEWLEHYYGGGTDMDVPLDVLPGKWKELKVPEGRTDIIQITDCCCHVPDELAASFNKFKEQHKVKMTCIVIGGDDAGPLKVVSDRTYSVADLDIESDAVGETLSL